MAGKTPNPPSEKLLYSGPTRSSIVRKKFFRPGKIVCVNYPPGGKKPTKQVENGGAGPGNDERSGSEKNLWKPGAEESRGEGNRRSASGRGLKRGTKKIIKVLQAKGFVKYTRPGAEETDEPVKEIQKKESSSARG